MTKGIPSVGTGWPIACRCGRSWSNAAWYDLAYVGEFVVGEARIEMRECECGSTISVLPQGPFLPPSLVSTSRVRRFEPDRTAPHVLVVDDDPIVARLVERGLSGAWRTSIAQSTEAMLTAISHGARFDAILLDVEMPGIGVREAFTRLRALDATIERRVVFMTGGPASDEARGFLSSVDNSLLRKPFPFSLLRDLLDVVHRQAAVAAS